MKSKLRIILFASIPCFVAICAWSDYYYSKLERDYTALRDFHDIEGVVTDLRVHWNHSYLTINSQKRVVVMPTKTVNPEIRQFSDLIDVGDSIHKSRNSDDVILKKDGIVYIFRNNERH